MHVGEDKLHHARYSTEELVGTERRVLAQAEARRGTIYPAERSAVDAAIERRPSIGDDQADAVRQLTRDGDAVQVVRAPAGTG